MSINAWNPVCIHYLLLCPASLRQAFRLSRTTFVWKVCIQFEYITEAVYWWHQTSSIKDTRAPVELLCMSIENCQLFEFIIARWDSSSYIPHWYTCSNFALSTMHVPMHAIHPCIVHSMRKWHGGGGGMQGALYFYEVIMSAYQNNPYSKAHCSKVNRFENLHVAYK